MINHLPSHDQPSTISWSTIYHLMINHLPSYDQPSTILWSTIYHLMINHLPFHHLPSTISWSTIYHFISLTNKPHQMSKFWCYDEMVIVVDCCWNDPLRSMIWDEDIYTKERERRLKNQLPSHLSLKIVSPIIFINHSISS